MSGAKILVCGRADAPRAAVNSDFTRFCSRCAHRVMIAPSGQRLLASHPDFEIICEECFTRIDVPEDAEFRVSVSLADEIRTAIPNPFLRRN